jgi:hypothetical protein
MYHPIGWGAANETIIYIDAQIQEIKLNTKFSVMTMIVSSTNVISVLKILSVVENDSLFTYKCSCDSRRACAHGHVPSAQVNITIIDKNTTSKVELEDSATKATETTSTSSTGLTKETAPVTAKTETQVEEDKCYC